MSWEKIILGDFEDFSPRDKIYAEQWNMLWRQIRTVSDNNTNGIEELFSNVNLIDKLKFIAGDIHLAEEPYFNISGSFPEFTFDMYLPEGIKGDPGDDGVSPLVTTERSGSIVTVNIEDVTGDHEFEISDGVSPEVSVSRDSVNKKVTVSVTDAEGTTTADIFDGEDAYVADLRKCSLLLEAGETSVSLTNVQGSYVWGWNAFDVETGDSVLVDISNGQGSATSFVVASAYSHDIEIDCLVSYDSDLDAGNILSDTSDELATKAWVQSQGYLTNHQSLAAYALKTELPVNTSDLVNDSGFLTSADVSAKADKTYVDSSVQSVRNLIPNVDSAISGSSTNPVQNKVIYSQLAGKAPINHSHAWTSYTDQVSGKNARCVFDANVVWINSSLRLGFIRVLVRFTPITNIAQGTLTPLFTIPSAARPVGNSALALHRTGALYFSSYVDINGKVYIVNHEPIAKNEAHYMYINGFYII